MSSAAPQAPVAPAGSTPPSGTPEAGAVADCRTQLTLTEDGFGIKVVHISFPNQACKWVVDADAH